MISNNSGLVDGLLLHLSFSLGRRQPALWLMPPTVSSILSVCPLPSRGPVPSSPFLTA